MARRLFTVLSAISLVCLVYLCMGAINNWTFKSRTSAVSGVTVDRPGLIHVGRWDGGTIIGRRNVLGFQRVEFLRNDGTGADRLLDVPYWPFVALASILPLVWASRQLREHRAASRITAGLCPNCGYDLRATPGRCPECGSAPAGKGA